MLVERAERVVLWEPRELSEKERQENPEAQLGFLPDCES